MFLVLFFTGLLALSSGVPVPDSQPKICLENGACYSGSWYSADNGARFASFQGVRYAMEPSYSLRFKRPVAFEPEANMTYDVSHESKIMCPQLLNDGEFAGQEDCLVLNIYVPEKYVNSPIDKANVMVWIHGGGLVQGSNNYEVYGPNEFIKRDVIMVAMNYRLGPLGFISTYEPTIGGNNGFRDQVMALQWVKNNIGRFGGDAESVTLFGQSAGGLGVSLHLLSPLSKGLFNRCIIQSGPAISFGAGVQDSATAQSFFYDLAGKLHCPELPLRCMEFKSVESIIRHSQLFTNDPYGLPLVWSAVVEDSYSPQPFLPSHPMDILASGDFNTDVEVVIGTNQADGLFMVQQALNDSSLWDQYAQSWESAGTRALFNIPDPSRVSQDDVDRADFALQHYVGSTNSIGQENSNDMIDMFTDNIFLWGTQKMVRLMAGHGMDVYQYIFSYEGSLSSGFGVNHSEDRIYLFNPPYSSLTDTDREVRNFLAESWVNFAMTGNPNNPDVTTRWEKCVSENYPIHYLNITGPSPTMEGRPELGDRMDFWESLMS